MIAPGVILIEPHAPRPRCFEADRDSNPSGWTSIRYALTPHQLEKELSATGWTFFFMAGAIRTTALAFNPSKALNSALKRVIRAVKQQQCNCLQIESLETRSFLGVPYLSMSVRSRHIQRGTAFAGSSLGARTDIAVIESLRKVTKT